VVGSGNEENFASINAKLPGSLKVLENDDPLAAKIIALPVCFQYGRVLCVRSRPKPTT
jgi:hypothetical protein